MAVIDSSWADYLETIEAARQGIPMMALSGLNPFLEFQKTMDVSFNDLLESIDKQIVQYMHQVQIGPSGIDLEKEGLKSPSSTWTYLVSDNPFGDRLEVLLGSNIGFAAFAGIYWPLLALYFSVKHFLKRKSNKVFKL